MYRSNLPAADKPPLYEGTFEPEAYVGRLRTLLKERVVVVVGEVTSEEAAALAQEEERTTLFLADYIADQELDRDRSMAKRLRWLHEGFQASTRGLAKATFRAAKAGYLDTAYTDMAPEEQDQTRAHLLTAHLKISELLSQGSPRKKHLTRAPVLFHSPADVEAVIAANTDLPLSAIAQPFFSHHRDPAAVIAEMRQSTEHIQALYPALSHEEARKLAVQRATPAKIERYVTQRGIANRPSKPVDIPPEELLAYLRERLVEGTLALNGLRDRELLRQSAKVQTEAEELIDSFAGDLSAAHTDPEYETLRAGFAWHMGRLAILAYKAWRKGLISAPLEGNPEEFRQELYTACLADFVLMHSALSSKISNKANFESPLLHLDSATVRELAERHSDIETHILRRIIRLDYEQPETQIALFRQALADIRSDRPDLTAIDAQRLASRFSQPDAVKSPAPIAA